MLSEEDTIETEFVYKGRILNLRIDTVDLPSGNITKREIIEHGASVVVFTIDKLGNALLVKQFRKAVDHRLLEAPAGGIENGESANQAAIRELKEETGYTTNRLVPLGGFWLAPGFCTEYMYAFLAQDAVAGDSCPEDDENIEVITVPFDEVFNLIKIGEIQDAKTIAVFLMATKELDAN